MALQCVGAILGGSIFGNCCSPIADTTIITALSTGCDLQAHTRTVLPYMLAPGLSAFLFGSVPVAMGWYPSAVGILLSAAMLVLFLFLVGRKPGTDAPAPIWGLLARAGLLRAGASSADGDPRSSEAVADEPLLAATRAHGA